MIEKYYYPINKQDFNSFMQGGFVFFKYQDEKFNEAFLKVFAQKHEEIYNKLLTTGVKLKQNFSNKDLIYATKIIIFQKSRFSINSNYKKEKIFNKNLYECVLEFSPKTLSHLFDVAQSAEDDFHNKKFSIMIEEDNKITFVIFDFNCFYSSKTIEKLESYERKIKRRLDLLSFKNVYLKENNYAQEMIIKEIIIENSEKIKNSSNAKEQNELKLNSFNINSMFSTFDIENMSIDIEDLEKLLQNSENS